MRTLWQDLQYGLRMLTKSPGFTAVAVLTLALGIGTNTVIFSVVNGVLLRPLPYPNHDRLLRIGESHPGEQSLSVTYATYLDLAREAKTIENPAAFRDWAFNLTGDSEAQPERAAGALVSGNFFAALGSKPLLGRMITPEDNDPGGNNRVAVLGYALWESRYGGQRDVLRLMLRQGMGVTMIGVAIGLATAFGLTRLMSTLLYGVSASDPATFAGVAILLFAIALVACHIPARRAMRVDPMVALRYE